MKRHGTIRIQRSLKALKLHSENIDKKMDEMKTDLENRMDEGFKQVDQRFERMDQRFKQVDQRFEQMDQRFKQVDKRFDSLDKKVDGIRVDLSEAQETTDYLSSKVVQHKKKIRTIN